MRMVSILDKECNMKLAKLEQKPTILIADDDITTRMLLRATITQWGYPVVEACDGEEAWDMLCSDNPPQIVTVDWLMPKIDGMKLCKLSKKLVKPPYIILLTSMAGTANIVKALESGADDFLTKPFNFAELRSRLLVGQRFYQVTTMLESVIKNQQSNTKIPINKVQDLLTTIIKRCNQFSAEWEKLDNFLEHFPGLQSDNALVLKQFKENFHKNQQQVSKELRLLETLIKGFDRGNYEK